MQLSRDSFSRYRAEGWHSAEAAVEAALTNYKEGGGGVTRCKVYAVGDAIVEGHSQARLADAIEAYQLKGSGSKAGGTLYCKRNDGSVYQTSSSGNWAFPSCGPFTEITKAEYDRLKDKKTVTASVTRSTGKTVYCKESDGTVYSYTRDYSTGLCGKNKKITEAEYDRLKYKKTETATTSKSETEPSNDDPLEAKLEKLKRLLEKGLITKEEAAAKRAKLLEDM